MAASGDNRAFRTERCGLTLDAAVQAIELQAAPALLTPIAGSTIATSTSFTWPAFSHGVSILQLVSDTPSSASPTIYLFTADAQATFPDLTPSGLRFPSNALYHVTVGGLGPFDSIDDAVGPAGSGAVIAPEIRNSYGGAVDLTTAP